MILKQTQKNDKGEKREWKKYENKKKIEGNKN